jgi:cupin 2 domain-containing protein
MEVGNLFESISCNSEEVFDLIVQKNGFKIERIISKGHSSPSSGWYDQNYNEWVVVLKGEAVLSFAESVDVILTPGSYVNIPAHTKHKVKWTHPALETVWLAVHY